MRVHVCMWTCVSVHTYVTRSIKYSFTSRHHQTRQKQNLRHPVNSPKCLQGQEFGNQSNKTKWSESLSSIPHIKTHLHGPELWFLTSREDSRHRAFANTVARISETKKKKAREGRRTKLHKIALEWSNEGEYDWRSKYHRQEKREMYTTFWSANVNARDIWDLDVNRKIDMWK